MPSIFAQHKLLFFLRRFTQVNNKRKDMNMKKRVICQLTRQSSPSSLQKTVHSQKVVIIFWPICSFKIGHKNRGGEKYIFATMNEED